MPLKMHFAALLLLCIALIPPVFAQTQLLATIDHTKGYLSTFKKVNNSLLLGGYDFAGWLNPQSGGYKAFPASPNYIMYSQANNSQGAFYLSYQNGFFLKFESETAHMSKALPNSNGNYSPYTPVVCNNKYYVCLRDNVGYNIWESDGTEAGTRIAYFNTQEITGAMALGDTLVYCVASGATYELHAYLPDGSTQTFANLANKPVFLNCDQPGWIYYTNGAATWRSNLQSSEKLFSYAAFGNLAFVNAAYYAWYLSGNGAVVQKCNANATQPKDLTYRKQDSEYRQMTQLIFNKDFLLGVTPNTGLEPVRVNYATDSLEIIKDLYKGRPGSMYQNFNSRMGTIYQVYNNELYFFATNGNDDDYYLYKTNGQTMTSLFKAKLDGGITALIIDNGWAYWATDDQSRVRVQVYKRSLADVAPQPISRLKSEAWNKFVFFDGGVTSPPFIINSETQADQNGNLVTSFLFNSQSQRYYVAASDTTPPGWVAANNIIIKYDRYGKTKWINYLNSVSAIFAPFANARFCLDTAGNVITVGTFKQAGIFDGDTMKGFDSAPNVLYMAKLNAETGKVMWKKKLSENYFSDAIMPDKLVCDRHNNVYMAFMYSGSCSIAGSVLGYSLAPVNAMCKFNDSNLLWIKNTPTPWTDRYGHTYNLLCSGDQVIAVQSQGYFTTSATCHYTTFSSYIQRLDANGNVVYARNIKTSDISSMSAATLCNDAVFFTGYYRDSINIDGFKHTTAPDVANAGCTLTENFCYLADAGAGKLRRLSVTDHAPFFPFKAASDGRFIYVLGFDQQGMLGLKRYDSDGRLNAKRSLNKLTRGDFDFYYDLNVAGNYLVVSGKTDEYRRFDTAVSPFTSIDTRDLDYAILKFNKNDGWLPDSDVQVLDLVDTDEDILVYPNPGRGILQVQLKNPDDYTAMALYDLFGHKLIDYALDGEYHQRMDLSELPMGTYILKVTGNRTVIKKIIRH